MDESLIVKYCSPTLAGLKTGNLFNCQFKSREELDRQIRDINRRLNSKGVHIKLLKSSSNKALVYVYRPDKLEKDFLNEDTSCFLHSCGYLDLDVKKCVVRLADRLAKMEAFPHEIGLFLGYPHQDVKGFIENKGKNFKYRGYWKVYGDKSRAKIIFEKYKKCTRVYCKKLSEGLSIQRLTVAV